MAQILRELRELKNFNGITNVMAGLGNSAVRRLKHTFAVSSVSTSLRCHLRTLYSVDSHCLIPSLCLY